MKKSDIKTAKWVGEWTPNWGGPYNGSVSGEGFGRRLMVGGSYYWISYYSWYGNNRNQRELFLGGRLATDLPTEDTFLLSKKASKIFRRPEEPRDVAFRIWAKGEKAWAHKDEEYRFAYLWRDFPGLFLEEAASPDGRVVSVWCNGNCTLQFALKGGEKAWEWEDKESAKRMEAISIYKKRAHCYLVDGV